MDVRERWTESYTKWSPQGSYFATFHSKGIALWGGPGFQKISRLAHPGVQFIDFSPCEKYIVTFSPNIDPRYKLILICWLANFFKGRDDLLNLY